MATGSFELQRTPSFRIISQPGKEVGLGDTSRALVAQASSQAGGRQGIRWRNELLSQNYGSVVQLGLLLGGIAMAIAHRRIDNAIPYALLADYTNLFHLQFVAFSH